ncbi:MAG: hypothetical protein ACTTJS_04085 [Wolinella sp.]
MHFGWCRFRSFALKEFENNKPQTLERMRELYKERGLKSLLYFKEVRAQWFVIALKSSPKEKSKSEYIYKEQSRGEFRNLAKDEGIRAKIEEIREVIRRCQ